MAFLCDRHGRRISSDELVAAQGEGSRIPRRAARVRRADGDALSLSEGLSQRSPWPNDGVRAKLVAGRDQPAAPEGRVADATGGVPVAVNLRGEAPSGLAGFGYRFGYICGDGGW